MRQEVGAAHRRNGSENRHSLDLSVIWQAEAQASTQGTPVLLTLRMNTAGNGETHLLTTAQEDVHQLHMRPEGIRERDKG